LHALAFDASGKLLVGCDGGIWRLENPNVNNLQWADLNNGLATLQAIGAATDPTNPNHTTLGTQDNGTSIFTGNLSWALTDGGDGGFTRIDQSNPSVAYHTFYRIRGGAASGGDADIFIYRSADGGNTWPTNISSGIGLN